MQAEGEPEEMIFSARDLLRWRWQAGKAPGIAPPEAVILCLHPPTFRAAQKYLSLKPVDGLFGSCGVVKNSHGRVALAGEFGLGAPAMAILVEEYVAFGVRRFLSVGTAGGLQPELQAGDIVVCTRAFRQEGTSAHYLPPSPGVEASEDLAHRIGTALAAHNLPYRAGPSWTTDAPYRESRRAAAVYRQEGVLAVEMEASALFAAARALGAEAAGVMVVADRLSPQGWEPPDPPGMARVQKTLEAVLKAAADWLGREGL